MRKKWIVMLTVMSLSAIGVASFCAQAEESETEAATEISGDAKEEFDEGIWPEIAGENGITYDNLFEVILDEDCYDYWYENCVEAVGEEEAEATVEMLQGFISSDLYGEEAVEAYADADSFSFDCWYINDAKSFTFGYNDRKMTAEIEKTDGTVEIHTYEYLGVYQIGSDETMVWGGEEFCPAFDCDVYQSTDEAGEFTYFFFRDDTMEETYHIEFRYGSDLEELQGYMKGKYAYWLAAGFDVDADEETLKNVISLFCEENVG